MQRKITSVSIIGGGASGLASAISLVLFGGIDPNAIKVFEPRQPIRSNILVLPKPAVARLKALGVASILKQRNQIGNLDRLCFLRNEVEEQVAEPMVVSPMDGHLIDLEDDDDEPFLEPVPMAEIIDAQKTGAGIVGVVICDLERALRDRAEQLGIYIIEAAATDLVLNNQSGYQIVLDDGSVDEPDLVILAEGNSRRLVTRCLPIPIEVCSKQEHYARVHIKFNIGPILCTGFLNPKDPKSKFLVMGDPVQTSYAQTIIQVKEPFNLVNGRHDECKTGTEPQYSFHEGSGFVLKEVAIDARSVFHKLNLPQDVVFSSMAPRSFVVQDTMLKTTTYENVVVIGDAAHSGHFLSGVGTAVGILFDSDVLLKLIMGGSTAEFAESMRSGTKEWFSYDKKTWFEG
ncbi:UNVERIFIED_CONTAM: hypothetical protein HDU68_001016 [Siphonaria sp. JEL0065]|nr:hypothetical protein HDU68_001016 [Siphonaria sp. JEL0065]